MDTIERNDTYERCVELLHELEDIRPRLQHLGSTFAGGELGLALNEIDGRAFDLCSRLHKHIQSIPVQRRYQ